MITETRDFKGVWIKKEIWLDKNLSIQEKCLIIEIDSLDNDDRGCFASNKYLAEFIGLSEGRTANIISSLRKRGYLYNSFNDGRKRGIKLTKCENRFHENVKAGSRKRESSLNENVNIVIQNSNTINNTDSLRSDEKEFSSYEPEIIEEDSEEKKEKETFFDVPAKPQEEKQRKNSAKKKEPTLTHKMRQAFESYYEAKKKKKYYYTAKDGRALKEIISKLTYTIRNKYGRDYNPLDGEMVKSWEYMLTNLKSSNIWVYNNLDISKINSQYNQIIANIKSGNNGQTRNGNGATNEEVAEILKKYDII